MLSLHQFTYPASGTVLPPFSDDNKTDKVLVAFAYNLRTQEAAVVESRGKGQPGLHSEILS